MLRVRLRRVFGQLRDARAHSRSAAVHGAELRRAVQRRTARYLDLLFARGFQHYHRLVTILKLEERARVRGVGAGEGCRDRGGEQVGAHGTCWKARAVICGAGEGSKEDRCMSVCGLILRGT